MSLIKDLSEIRKEFPVLDKVVYLDNAATTKVDERVFEKMKPYFIENYGNASSQHIMGREGKDALEKSRKTIAKPINAKTGDIYFTSGGTESNNFILIHKKIYITITISLQLCYINYTVEKKTKELIIRLSIYSLFFLSSQVCK